MPVTLGGQRQCFLLVATRLVGQGATVIVEREGVVAVVDVDVEAGEVQGQGA